MNKDEFRGEFIRITRDMQGFMREMMGPVCKRHNVTLQHLYVLMELNLEPQQTVSELCGRVGILRTNFAQVCHKLEEKELIERKHNALDKRSFTLQLSEKGQRLVGAIGEDVDRVYGNIFRSEPDETFVTILKGFEALSGFTKRFDH
jgi:DNA-binding MarR family transcriptional regulator